MLSYLLNDAYIQRMAYSIVEIKARCRDHEPIRQLLEKRKARFVGIDHQVDTYFKAKTGRMKLREGKIENSLIHYERPNQAGPKHSAVNLFRTVADPQLKTVLCAGLEVLTVVDKQRAIYFINNVKFHLDEVKTLGRFIEIEAIDETNSISLDSLQAQCQHYLDLFGVESSDLVQCSYSDLLLEKV